LRPELGAMMLGPEEPYVSKIRGLFIRQILIKIVSPTPLRPLKQVIRNKVQIFKENKDYRGVRVVVDVDP